MSLPVSRQALIFAAAFLSLACSADLTDPATSPLAAPSFAQAPYEVTDESITLRPGGTRQLAATKTANGKAVPDPSVSWSSADASVATVSATGLVTGVKHGRTVVSATRGVLRVDVVVNVTCPVGVLPVGVTQGEITPDDCLFTFAGRRSDYYAVASGNGEVIGILSTGVRGITGIKQETVDPATGTVFASRAVGPRYRVISNGDPLQFYISGFNGDHFGAYTVTRSVDTETFTCNQLTFVVPGASFNANLQPSNSCAYNILYSPYPEVIGKQINTHRYWAKLEAKEYTVAIGGLTSSFNPAVTIFPNILNAGPIAQSIDGPGTQSARSVTFTASTAGYYLIEISSGRFVGGEWTIQSGPFSLSLTR